MKFLKITFLPTLLLMSLVLSGCAKNNANTNTAEANNNTNQVVSAVNASNTNGTNNTNTQNNNTNLNNSGQNENVNQVNNENINNNTNTDIDISDWQTYTNKEYGFNFKYPKNWFINNNNEINNLRINIFNISNESTNNDTGPTSVIGPNGAIELNVEIKALIHDQDSQFGGEKLLLDNNNYFKYYGYIEGGILVTRYLTKLNNQTLLEVKYYEGDNFDYSETLKKYTRDELLEQYRVNEIQNLILKERYKIFDQVVSTIILNS